MVFSPAGGRPFQAEINTTRMIDVLLVLIIVFTVVVSMSKGKGLDTQIPQPANEHSPPPPIRTIIIWVEWGETNSLRP